MTFYEWLSTKSHAGFIWEGAPSGTEVPLKDFLKDDKSGSYVYALVKDLTGSSLLSDGPFTIDPSTGHITVRDASLLESAKNVFETLFIKSVAADGSVQVHDLPVAIVPSVYADVASYEAQRVQAALGMSSSTNAPQSVENETEEDEQDEDENNDTSEDEESEKDSHEGTPPVLASDDTDAADDDEEDEDEDEDEDDEDEDENEDDEADNDESDDEEDDDGGSLTKTEEASGHGEHSGEDNRSQTAKDVLAAITLAKELRDEEDAPPHIVAQHIQEALSHDNFPHASEDEGAAMVSPHGSSAVEPNDVGYDLSNVSVQSAGLCEDSDEDEDDDESSPPDTEEDPGHGDHSGEDNRSETAQDVLAALCDAKDERGEDSLSYIIAQKIQEALAHNNFPHALEEEGTSFVPPQGLSANSGNLSSTHYASEVLPHDAAKCHFQYDGDGKDLSEISKDSSQTTPLSSVLTHSDFLLI